MPAQSVREAIGIAAKAAVDAEAFLWNGAAVPCVVRKVGTLPSGADAPQVVVVVAAEEPTERIDRRRRLESFTLWAVIVTPGGHKLANDPTVGNWRDRILSRLDDRERTTFATLITGAEINSADAIQKPPPFDPAGLAKDLNYSALSFRVTVLVRRS